MFPVVYTPGKKGGPPECGPVRWKIPPMNIAATSPGPMMTPTGRSTRAPVRSQTSGTRGPRTGDWRARIGEDTRKPHYEGPTAIPAVRDFFENGEHRVPTDRRVLSNETAHVTAIGRSNSTRGVSRDEGTSRGENYDKFIVCNCNRPDDMDGALTTATLNRPCPFLLRFSVVRYFVRSQTTITTRREVVLEVIPRVGKKYKVFLALYYNWTFRILNIKKIKEKTPFVINKLETWSTNK